MKPRHAASTAATLLAVAASLAQTGCSLQRPYNTPPPTTPASTARDAKDPAPERNGRIAPAAQHTQDQLARDAAAPSAQAALDHYARLAVNWDWRDLAAVQRRLAAISLGQARAQAQATAAQAATNTTLRADHVTNTGQPVSIAPGRGTAKGQWVIVTSEQTRGHGPYAGLPPTVHVTYAQVTRTPAGYVVDQWHPQT